MSLFATRYRTLPTEAKTLLSVTNKECGFGVAAELCQHLFKMHHDGIDDRFWDNVDDSDGAAILDIAKAQGMKKVGSFDLMQIA